MSFRANAETTDRLERGPRCSVELLLQTLDGDDRDWLVEVMADKTRGHTWISHVLRKENVSLSQAVIGRHRRNDCRCVT